MHVLNFFPSKICKFYNTYIHSKHWLAIWIWLVYYLRKNIGQDFWIQLYFEKIHCFWPRNKHWTRFLDTTLKTLFQAQKKIGQYEGSHNKKLLLMSIQCHYKRNHRAVLALTLDYWKQPKLLLRKKRKLK